MFIIGGNQRVCPRGYICLNNYNAVLVLLAIIVVGYFINKQTYLSIYNKILEKTHLQSQQIMPKLVSNPPVTEIPHDSSQQGYSYDKLRHGAVIEQPFNNPTRATGSRKINQQSLTPDVDRMLINDPLYPPLSRNYHEDPTGRIEPVVGRGGIPINIETRGSGGDFQQVGILSKNDIKNDGEAPGNNTDSNILPLYGKPTYRGSNRWLYYTETDKFNPIKIPITVNNKDCTDDQGCEELYDGGEVSIPSYNGVFKVKIYKFNKPRYIPLENPREIMPLPFT